MSSSFSIAQVVNDKVLEALNSDRDLPWIKPWRSAGIGTPFNPVSKTEYRGINFLTLSLINGADSQFITAKQAFKLGGKPKKGMAQPVIYFNFVEKEETDAQTNLKPSRYALMKYFNVWNVQDIEGVSFDTLEPREIVVNAVAEQLVSNAGITLTNGTEGKYTELSHQIQMPERNRFINDDFYYATLFHQLVHSTKSELKRVSGKNDQGNAFEELVAELGASMLCAHAGVDAFSTDHTAAYIQPWINALEGDKHYIIMAAQRAQKAVDFLLGKAYKSVDRSTDLLAA